MADVVLNLFYKDNGAGVAVNNLVNQLKQLESKQYKINIAGANVQQLQQLEQAAKNVENTFVNLSRQKTRFVDEGKIRDVERLRVSYFDLQKAIESVQRSIDSKRNQLVLEFSKGNVDTIKTIKAEISDYKNQLEYLQRNLNSVNVQNAVSQFRSLGEEIAKNIELLKKYGTTNVRQDDAVGRTVSAMLGLSPLPSSARTAVPQRPGRSYANYLDYSGLRGFSDEINKRQKEISDKTQKTSNELALSIGRTFGQVREKYVDEWAEVNEIARKEISDNYKLAGQLSKEEEEKLKDADIYITQGYRQAWSGVSQAVNSAFQTMRAGYETFKNVITAPLNLTGVSSLVSMLESMEGSLLLDQISSNITTGFSQGLERFDILHTYPPVIEHLGYSAEEASASMDRLYQSVLGLPTSFSDIVSNAQQFTLLLDDLERGTDLAIAANNAFVASGADSQQISSGMRQLQYMLEGTKLRSTQWYSLIRSMPIALKEIGENLGYESFPAFTAALREGNIESEVLIDNLIEVGLHSENLGNILEVMKSRVTASLTNVRNAATRLGDTLIETLDKTLRQQGGKGISENIKGVSDIIDHIAEVASDWIVSHGPEIQALLDKFFNIDWASVVPGFLEGLVDVANKALDNIGTWIQDIGGIISDVRTLFNDLENSQLVKFISGIGGVLSGTVGVGAGIANAVAGFKLVEKGNGIISALGGTAAGAGGGAIASGIGSSVLPFLGYTAIGVLIGDFLLKITEEGFAGVKDTIVVKLTDFMSGVVDEATEVTERRKNIAHQNAVRIALEYQRSQLLTPWNGPGVPSSFTRDVLGNRLEEVAKIVSGSGFDESGWVHAMLLRIGGNLEQVSGKEGLKIYKAANDIAEKIQYYKTAYIDGLDDYLKELESRIQYYEKLNEKLQEQIDKPIEYFGQDKFEKLYGDGGFFSKQYKKAKGWGYSNTVADVQESYEELYPKAQGVLEGLYEAALQLDGEDRDKVLKGFYGELASIDWSNADDLKRIVENYGNKTPGEVFSQYFIPRATVSELEDGMSDFSSNLQIAINNLLIGSISDEEDRTRKRRNHFVEKLWDDTVDDTETLYEQSGLIETIDTASEEIVSALESILSDLDPSEAQNEINSFFTSLEDFVEISYGIFLNKTNNLPKAKIKIPTPQTEFEGGRLIARSTGGFTPMGTDTIPAMLTPGEYVQRRAAVEHFGRQFMERINNLDLRGALRSISMNYATPYATGGFVRNDNRNYRDNHATVNQIFKSANASTGFRRASRFVRALG